MSIAGGASAPSKAPRWLTALTAVLVAGISLLAFGLSFEVLSDLAIRAGLPAGIAWAWPVIVDGSIVTAMLVIFAWRGRPRRATVWPWVTLLFFAALSVVGNGVHTAVVFDATQGITMWFAIFVGAIPPVGLLLSSEMLVRLLTPADAVVAAVATLSHDPDTKVTEAVAVLEEALCDDTDATVSPEPFAATVTPDATVDANQDTDATPVVAVTHLHTVEVIPADPAGQIDWIVARAHAGHDMTRETLLQVFEKAGQSMSDRTLQRRLADARRQAPELVQANA